MSSFLRWAGSKRKLLPELREYWSDDFARYVEPFAGSAQLLFDIDAGESLLSDKNWDLIEVYQQIKNQPYAVYRILRNFKNTEEEYYRIRRINPDTLGVNQRAARFIYLNWLCFNGLFRCNLKGEFNVPYSHEPNKKIDNWELLKATSLKLQKATIKHGDFEGIVKKNLRKSDFVYLDPPYAIENVRIFNQYGNHTFGISDLRRLSSLLEHIDKKGACFVVSYAADDFSTKLFRRWNVKRVQVQRNIAGFAEHRRKSTEIIVTNR